MKLLFIDLNEDDGGGAVEVVFVVAMRFMIFFFEIVDFFSLNDVGFLVMVAIKKDTRFGNFSWKKILIWFDATDY